MPRKYDLLKINLPAGMIRVNQLLKLLKILEGLHIKEVSGGARQQLFVRSTTENAGQLLSQIEAEGLVVEVNKFMYPNIVSSYVCQDVFHDSPTVSEGVYKDILESFNYSSRLKINLIDQQQSFVPFFTGHLNFISSSVANYWHLRLRFPGTDIYYSWPGLVYFMDIARLSIRIELILSERMSTYQRKSSIDGEQFYNDVISGESFHFQQSNENIEVPHFKLPYYEGFNVFQSRTWLGIYRRNESFPIDFLIDVCRLCVHANTTELFFTPWKSLIIKNIDTSARMLWDAVLDKHRINVRHASNELNWQVEDASADALALKHKLVAVLDKNDTRTYGLCFAIKTKPRSGLFGSVVIRKQVNLPGKRELYSLLYSRNFNPNTKDLILFRKDIGRKMISTYLVSLCRYYYDQQSEAASVVNKVFRDGEEKQQLAVTVARKIHQCKECYTVYDVMYGDPGAGVISGTHFETLPSDYCCSTCGASVQNFSEIQANSLQYEGKA